MRDVLVAAVFFGVLPFVFRHAWIGVLLWTWISVMNPHKLAFGFMHDAPLGAIVAGATLIGLLTTRDRIRWSFAPPLKFVAYFLIWTCVSTAFAFFVQDSAVQLIKILKIHLMIFVTAAVLYKREHIRWFIWVNVLSIGFYGFKGGIYTLSSGGGGRVWGPPGGFIEGNNEIALALIITIPLMNFLRLTSPHRWVRIGLVVLMLLSAVAAVGTQSRGAFLAIAAMGIVMWWRAPNKLPGAVVGALAAISILAFMPQSWHERMSTISTYEQDRSAMGRIYAWQTAINVANDRVAGAGYSMYSPDIFLIYYPRDTVGPFDPSVARAAHSIYFQVLGEHGYIGLFLFLMTWASAWRVAGRLRRGTRDDPDAGWLFHLGGMTQVALVGYAVGGAFLSLAYFDLPYNVLVALVVAERWRAEWAVPVADAVPKRLAGHRSRFHWIRTA